MAQNMPKDERSLFRHIAELAKRVAALETATRAGNTSVSFGKLTVLDGDTGAVIASLSSADDTDDDGNTVPAGLGAEVGDLNGEVVRDNTIGPSKVTFTARDLSGVTTTTSPTEPTGPIEGDLWIDTSSGNVLKRYDGAAWAALPVGTDAIQAGAVTASQVAANTLTAAQVAAGGLTAETLSADAIDGKIITGATIITDSSTGGVYIYDGPPAAGNLIVSISSDSGADAFGNTYTQGLNVFAGEIDGAIINASTITAGAISAGSVGGSQVVNSDFRGGTIENADVTFDANGGTLLVYVSTSSTLNFTSSGSFTVPAGVTALTVECWGGGGGAAGGSLAGGSNSGGYGGGGGAYAKVNALAVTPGAVLPYVVGGGGSGGAANNLGANGGSTSFNATACVAKGGVAATSAHIGTGGAAATSTGDVKFSGGNGGSATGSGGGGGGASAGLATNGNNGNSVSSSSGGAGGAGVTNSSGSGGDGGSSNTIGQGGNVWGGGGGGGGGGSSAGKGGNGARGQVRVSYSTGRALACSIASVAGVDPYGNSYPAGVGISGTDITAAWPSYTPAWTASTTNPALGNGTLIGRYMRIGKTVHVSITLTVGSSTNVGSGTYLFSLPFTSANAGVGYLGVARLTAGSVWIGQVTLGANSALINATFPASGTATTGANMKNDTPAALASGHVLTMSLTYQTA
jgi:hypothetical protein